MSVIELAISAAARSALARPPKMPSVSPFSKSRPACAILPGQLDTSVQIRSHKPVIAARSSALLAAIPSAILRGRSRAHSVMVATTLAKNAAIPSQF